MDYEVMLDYHKANNADVTIAAMPVPMEEASRFGIVIADEDGRIQEFQEKPAEPKSNLASMGIYIFSWKVLKEAFGDIEGRAWFVTSESISFHIVTIKARDLFAYEYNGLLERCRNIGILLGSQYGTDRYHTGVQFI